MTMQLDWGGGCVCKYQPIDSSEVQPRCDRPLKPRVLQHRCPCHVVIWETVLGMQSTSRRTFSTVLPVPAPGKTMIYR